MGDSGKAGDGSKNTVQSAAKIFAVLRAFDTENPELTISETAARAGLDRGTAFRLIHTLELLGYLACVPNSRRFRLTLKCLELGYSVLARGGLKTHARTLLREVVPDRFDAGSLGMLDGGDVVYVERLEGDLSRRGLDRRIGSRTGAYAAALGHAILAWLPPAEQCARLEDSERVKLSEHTLVDLEALLARLAAVRGRGYAWSDGENAYGLRTVAAPVRDQSGHPLAGVSLTIRAERMALDEFLAEGAPTVMRIADDLTQALRLSFGAIAEAVR